MQGLDDSTNMPSREAHEDMEDAKVTERNVHIIISMCI